MSDYGFADVAYHTKMYGNTSNVIDTPNLDALSATGIRLENYYVQVRLFRFFGTHACMNVV